MTHTKPMADDEGDIAPWKQCVSLGCPNKRCAVLDVWVRSWESSCGGYTDHQYECRTCGRTWWVEGADA